jgi:hypothetical protein
MNTCVLRGEVTNVLSQLKYHVQWILNEWNDVSRFSILKKC